MNQKGLGLVICIFILIMGYYVALVYISITTGESSSIADLLLLIINSIYVPADEAFAIIFFYCDSFLRTLSISIILILSIGKLLTLLKTNFYKCMKYILYIWYCGYCLWSFGIFTNIFSLDALDWTTFMFSVVAPLSMFIVGRQVSGAKVKGQKIFIYYVLMFLYLGISIVWWYYYPAHVNFTVLAIYWVITFFIVGLTNHIL